MNEQNSTELDEDLGLIDDKREAGETAGKPAKAKKSKEAKEAKKAKADKGAEVAAQPRAPAASMPPAPVVDELPAYVPADEPRRGLPRWVVAVGCLVGVALLVTTALAVIQWRRANDANSDLDATRATEIDRQEAAMVASRFTEALLTYDFNNLEVSKQKVIEVSTPEFAEKYGPAFQEGLQPVLSETQSIATATIRTVYMGDLTAEAATAVTIADQTVESNVQSLKKIGSYFKLELQKIDGAWKVASVTVLGVESTDETDKPADGSTTTTATTAPPSG